MTSSERRQYVDTYIYDIINSNTESAKKERLILLLGQLFHGDYASEILTQFTRGAEHSINCIKREKGGERGSADTQYGSVIIEFENNIARTGEHAVDQLREYLSGNWNEGLQLGFMLITTDCLIWRIYKPDFDTLLKLGSSIKARDVILDIVEDEFVLVQHTDQMKAEEQADRFYFYLDRILFKNEPSPATLEDIRKSFGEGSSTYQVCMLALHKYYAEKCNTTAMQTAYNEWHKFLSMAYGKFFASEKAFLSQSYLSILAKMLAFTVIEKNEFINEDLAREIVNGNAFLTKNVRNFTDNDFYRWTSNSDSFNAIKPVFYAIAKELSQFDFSNVHEDILKGVYQELADEDTRHDLGEFYTPDWLCSHVVEALDIQPGQKVLDPACGSGSFLKAVANHMRSINLNISADELNNCLYGIDIHPLSVQIAKATLLISYGDSIQRESKPLTLNIYLANTLLLPHEDLQFALMGKFYIVSVAGKRIKLHESIFKNELCYDTLIFDCNVAAQADVHVGKSKLKEQISSLFIQRFKTKEQHFLDSAYEIYRALSEAMINKQNGIWAYILQNSLRPFFLQGKFDVVVGNPPWLTFSDVENGDYQNDLKKLSELYTLRPSTTNMPHLELAALFLARACNYFLKESGKIGFVMPRAFFSASQHNPTRKGKTKRVKISEIWDLKDVSPLFKVPSCVIFAQQQRQQGAPAPKEIPGRSYSGRLPSQNLDRSEADKHLQVDRGTFYLSFLGDVTAWTYGEAVRMGGNNFYKDKFKQGATIVPRCFYFVDIDQPYLGDIQNRDIFFRTSATAKREAKKPWHNITLSGRVPTRFLYRTALSNNILPFVLNGTRFVLLPGVIEKDGLELLSLAQLQNMGELEAFHWFSSASNFWEQNRTEKNAHNSYLEYLDWCGKLSCQNMNSNYIVLYIAAGSNTCGAVFDRKSIDGLPFVAEHKTYVFFSNNFEEANYICGFLNATTPNKLIKPFQSQGLMGARDIEKKILEVDFPQFDPSNNDHLLLSRFAQQSAEKAFKFLMINNFGPDGGNLRPHALGQLRSKIREHLKHELSEIDIILNKMLIR